MCKEFSTVTLKLKKKKPQYLLKIISANENIYIYFS